MPDAHDASFTYVDLFAGIGGFATALNLMGGECVRAVEIDPLAAAVYERNHPGADPRGDISKIANEDHVGIPKHEVLTAGFPCQPFSKSGAQRGMDEARGTLFWNIAKILEVRRPPVVILENVRNLAGPRHRHEWNVIIRSLREMGYHVSSRPAVFSPHLLPASMGGAPQIRERVFITATYWPERSLMDPSPVVTNEMIRSTPWSLAEDLPLLDAATPDTALTHDEVTWINAWEDFRSLIIEQMMREATKDALDKLRLPGFPFWVDEWTHLNKLFVPPGTPRWKEAFLRKNSAFYTKYQTVLDAWMKVWRVRDFPASRRKFEWQAQQEDNLWKCAMQLRPSGIRAKRMTHLPALVAITQTPILGPLKRRLSIAEAAMLQGLPPTFDFGEQSASESYKQLGNGVNVGVVQHVLRQHVRRDENRLARIAPGLLPVVSQEFRPAHGVSRQSRPSV